MIVDLGMPIALWVVYHRELVGDLILGKECGYLLTGEVRHVIGDDVGPKAPHSSFDDD